jgi:hypothetical protein
VKQLPDAPIAACTLSIPAKSNGSYPVRINQTERFMLLSTWHTIQSGGAEIAGNTTSEYICHVAINPHQRSRLVTSGEKHQNLPVVGRRLVPGRRFHGCLRLLIAGWAGIPI